MIAGQNGPWAVCELCSDKFKVDKVLAKEFLKEWINNKGNYSPPKSEDVNKHLTDEQIEAIATIIVTV